jgi:hypothetical protein
VLAVQRLGAINWIGERVAGYIYQDTGIELADWLGTKLIKQAMNTMLLPLPKMTLSIDRAEPDFAEAFSEYRNTMEKLTVAVQELHDILPDDLPFITAQVTILADVAQSVKRGAVSKYGTTVIKNAIKTFLPKESDPQPSTGCPFITAIREWPAGKDMVACARSVLKRSEGDVRADEQLEASCKDLEDYVIDQSFSGLKHVCNFKDAYPLLAKGFKAMQKFMDAGTKWSKVHFEEIAQGIHIQWEKIALILHHCDYIVCSFIGTELETAFLTVDQSLTSADAVGLVDPLTVVPLREKIEYTMAAVSQFYEDHFSKNIEAFQNLSEQLRTFCPVPVPDGENVVGAVNQLPPIVMAVTALSLRRDMLNGTLGGAAAACALYVRDPEDIEKESKLFDAFDDDSANCDLDAKPFFQLVLMYNRSRDSLRNEESITFPCHEKEHHSYLQNSPCSKLTVQTSVNKVINWPMQGSLPQYVHQMAYTKKIEEGLASLDDKLHMVNLNFVTPEQLQQEDIYDCVTLILKLGSKDLADDVIEETPRKHGGQGAMFLDIKLKPLYDLAHQRAYRLLQSLLSFGDGDAIDLYPFQLRDHQSIPNDLAVALLGFYVTVEDCILALCATAKLVVNRKRPLTLVSCMDPSNAKSIKMLNAALTSASCKLQAEGVLAADANKFGLRTEVGNCRNWLNNCEVVRDRLRDHTIKQVANGLITQSKKLKDTFPNYADYMNSTTCDLVQGKQDYLCIGKNAEIESACAGTHQFVKKVTRLYGELGLDCAIEDNPLIKEELSTATTRLKHGKMNLSIVAGVEFLINGQKKINAKSTAKHILENNTAMDAAPIPLAMRHQLMDVAGIPRAMDGTVGDAMVNEAVAMAGARTTTETQLDTAAPAKSDSTRRRADREAGNTIAGVPPSAALRASAKSSSRSSPTKVDVVDASASNASPASKRIKKASRPQRIHQTCPGFQ